MTNKYRKKTAKKPGAPGVRPKKYLGQHFLTDGPTAEKIAATLQLKNYGNVLEIGPGTGALTKYLLQRDINLAVVERDAESVAYLKKNHPAPKFQIIEADFLKEDLARYFGGGAFAITGNFPYNISTQIVFKTLKNKHMIPEFTGMFQKEVAQRICAGAGSKTYGILSVLTQAFYRAEYLFTVPPSVFKPPPKVESGVIRLLRKEGAPLPCDEKMLYKVVKTAFQQRRKMLRNSLKPFNLPDKLKEDGIFGRRPEQLSVAQFISLTQKIADHAV